MEFGHGPCYEEGTPLIPGSCETSMHAQFWCCLVWPCPLPLVPSLWHVLTLGESVGRHLERVWLLGQGSVLLDLAFIEDQG